MGCWWEILATDGRIVIQRLQDLRGTNGSERVAHACGMSCAMRLLESLMAPSRGGDGAKEMQCAAEG
jgi:hypothetical protein